MRFKVIIIFFLLVLVIGGKAMALELKSSVFKNGEFIPDMYTCKGEDSSPPLSWSEVPDGTKSFALICDDPDAPMGTWVHWVIYDVPGEVRNFPSGIETKERLSDGTKQGINDTRRTGYHGPCPPPGKAHR